MSASTNNSFFRKTCMCLSRVRQWTRCSEDKQNLVLFFEELSVGTEDAAYVYIISFMQNSE